MDRESLKNGIIGSKGIPNRFAFRRIDRDDALWLGLAGNAASDQAMSLIDRAVIIVRESNPCERVSRHVRAAMDAVICDLFKAASSNVERYSYRSMSTASFTGSTVGYKPFRKAVDLLRAAGLIEVVPGYYRREDGARHGGRSTRFRGTAALFKLADQHGVCPSNWKAHYRTVPSEMILRRPILVRTDKAIMAGDIFRGKTMPLDMSNPVVKAQADRVNRLNAYFGGQVIDPAHHQGFQRIFNLGNRLSFKWNKGGRLYSLGGGYQRLPKEERRRITINGEETVEIDIEASQLTILNKLLGLPDFVNDPYLVDPSISRPVAKSWVTMTIGHFRFHRRWNDKTQEKYREKTGNDLRIDGPFKKVQASLSTNIQAFNGWLDCPHRWPDLHFMESEAVIDATERLAYEHDVPALPVYDSLIVGAAYASLAVETLANSFERVVGVRPRLKVDS